MKSNCLYYYLIIVLLTSFPRLSNADNPECQTFNAPYDISFIENQGQWADHILYKADLINASLFLETDRLTYILNHPDDINALHEARHHGGNHLPLTIRKHAFQLIFEGAKKNIETDASCLLQHHHNYFIGDDPKKWASKVPLFHEVYYRALYDGITMRWNGKGRGLKYEFLVEPGAKTSTIQMKYEGVDGLAVKDGHLHVQTSVNTLIELPPYAFQYINGQEVKVPCQFKIDGQTVSFDFPEGYDDCHELIIDPDLIFSTLSGSTADNWGFTATYDNQGNFYGAGIAMDNGYLPDGYLGAYQSTFGGGDPILEADDAGEVDVAISKFTPDGKGLIYATYLGGKGNEMPQSLIVDSEGQLIVLGLTSSTNFPIVSNAYDNTFNQGNRIEAASSKLGVSFLDGTDIFVAKFSEEGDDLVAGTYIGGNGNDGYNGADPLNYNYGDEIRGEVEIDGDNNIYITTSTTSTNFPTTDNAIRRQSSGGQDGILTIFEPDLSDIIYSTYLGSDQDDAAYGVKIDEMGNVFVTGGTNGANWRIPPTMLIKNYQNRVDGFVLKLSIDNYNISSFTFVGTNQYDQSYNIQLDKDNNVYIYGQTAGQYQIFPSNVYSRGEGQFIHKFTNDLKTTVFATNFGRGDAKPDISPTAFLVDICNRIYIAGWGGDVGDNSVRQLSTNGLPVTSNAYQRNTDGTDFYFMALEEDATALQYATFFGGSGDTEHVDGGTSRFDKRGIIYQAICAACGNVSTTFPTTPSDVWSTAGEHSDDVSCNLAAVKFDFQIPVVIAEAEIAPETTGCAPFTVTFNNNSFNATSYEWDFGDGSPTETTTDPRHEFTEKGVYTIRLIAKSDVACNVADTAYTTVFVKDPNSITTNFTSTVDCETLTVNFNSPNLETESYTWNFGDDSPTETGGQISHTYNTPGEYEVTLTANSTIPNCPATDSQTNTIVITDNVVSTFTLPRDQACFDDVFSFENRSRNAITWEWNFGDGNTSTEQMPQHGYDRPGEYEVTLYAFNEDMCNKIDTFKTTVYAFDTTIVATISSSIPDPCSDPNVRLVTRLNERHSLTWDFGDGSPTSIEYQPTHLYPGPGTYTVTLIANSPCALADTAELDVVIEEPPLVQGIITQFPESDCVPLSIQMAGDGNGVLYEWDLGDGTIVNGQSVNHTYTEPGVYPITYTVTDSSTCNINVVDNTSVEAYIVAIANFEANTLVAEIDQLINFTNLSSNADSYLWDFGDGNTSTTENPNHSYTTSGMYQVCLDALTDFDCNDQLCQTVEVIPPIIVAMPNAFTPNSDGLNDVLFLEGRDGVESITFRIFNRWGEMVFETTDPMLGWDGTYKGQDQDMDVYVYQISLTMITTKTADLKGEVTLLR